MRLIMLVMIFAALFGVAAAPGPAAAFDQARCDAVRAAANNEELADRLSAEVDPEVQDCLVRIALLRLGRMAEADYRDDARARAAYRIDSARYPAGNGAMSPAYVAALVASLRNNPSVMRDQIFARAFFQRTLGGGDAAVPSPGPTSPSDPGAAAIAVAAASREVPTSAGSVAKGDRLPTPPAGALADFGGPDTAPAGDANSARGLEAARPVPPELARRFAEPSMFPAGARMRLAPAALPQVHPLSPAVRALRGAAAERARREAEPGCADLTAEADPDVKRNLARIGASRLCLTRHVLHDGGVKWRFISLAHPAHPQGPVWYLPHDNEDEAFDAAVYAVSRYGGRLVAVVTQETRNHRGIDPNRAFAVSAADARPCAIAAPTPTYTAFVMDLYVGRPHIFSAHNNTNGGGVTANVWTDKAKGYPITKGPFGDTDNLVYIASDKPIASDAEATRMRQTLNAAGLGVVHEHVTRSNNDCSFSNHVVLNDGRPYFNLEAEHGSRVQDEMVDALLGALGYSPLADG